MDGKIVNIAGYRFVDLPDRDELRQPFRDICSKLNLKGTILLSHEGINFFLAGSRESIDSYIDYIEQDSRFKDITLKQSFTDYQPFNRMNVRLKKEIISIGLNHIKPAEFTGEEITPVDFKQLLDDGKEVLVLDTRTMNVELVLLKMLWNWISNHFEISLGLLVKFQMNTKTLRW